MILKKNKTTMAISLCVVGGFLFSATVVTALTILMGVLSAGHEGEFVFGAPGLDFGTVVRAVAADGSSTVSMTMGPIFWLTLLAPPIVFGLIVFVWRRRAASAANAASPRALVRPRFAKK